MSTTSRPRIEGYAIISREGMIALPDGSYPASLKIEGDQRFFHAALARAGGIVNGRNSADRRLELAARPRLVLTRQVDALAPHPTNPKAIQWNPAGADFEAAWLRLGTPGATAAVIGGTDVFGLFLDIGYDAFYLTRAEVDVPEGRPVFPLRAGETPEDILERHGLAIVGATLLDSKANTTVARWERQPLIP